MSTTILTAMNEKYISIYACSSSELLANEVVHACYDDFANSVLTLQHNNIEKKLRALIMAIERSFDVYEESELYNCFAIDLAVHKTRRALLDHLHYECNVVKFGINPIPGVSDLYKLWSMLVNERRAASSIDGDIILCFND